MPKSELKTFVLNDENKVNSYGFRILNKGIDLKRFKKNPVILNMHNHWSNLAVIGRWKKIRIEGDQLLADADFDLEDEDAAKIAGKVERGFLKACSMGINPYKDHYEIEDSGSHVLKKCELMEASIVSIPSNANAVRLFAQSGEPLSDDQITLSIPGTTSLNENQTNPKEMEKLNLSVGALMVLGITTDASPFETAKAVESLADKHKQLCADHKVLVEKRESEIRLSAETKVAAAVEAGKLKATESETWVQLAVESPALFESALSSIAPVVNLGTQVVGGAGKEVKTAEDFQNLSAAEQLKFKDENPEDYKKLFA